MAFRIKPKCAQWWNFNTVALAIYNDTLCHLGSPDSQGWRNAESFGINELHRVAGIISIDDVKLSDVLEVRTDG